MLYKTRSRLDDYTFPADVTEQWFTGWSAGEIFNTCAVPYFEKDEADRILTMLRSVYEDVAYEPPYDQYVFWEDIEMKREYRYDGQEMETPEGRKTLYPIGSWDWPWEAEGLDYA